MNLHTLKSSTGARQKAKRVGRGRGSGIGRTAGRGNKGQMSRKGHKHKLGFEGGQMRLVRRLPKRGFKNPAGRIIAVVNADALNRFEADTVVTPDVLREQGLAKGRWDGIKILGTGIVDRKLTVRAHAFSVGARQAIEAAGGCCEVLKP